MKIITKSTHLIKINEESINKINTPLIAKKSYEDKIKDFSFFSTKSTHLLNNFTFKVITCCCRL